MDACDLGYNTKLDINKKKHIGISFGLFFFGRVGGWGGQMQTIAKKKTSQTPFVMFRPRMQELLNIEQYCH